MKLYTPINLQEVDAIDAGALLKMIAEQMPQEHNAAGIIIDWSTGSACVATATSHNALECCAPQGTGFLPNKLVRLPSLAVDQSSASKSNGLAHAVTLILKQSRSEVRAYKAMLGRGIIEVDRKTDAPYVASVRSIVEGGSTIWHFMR